MSNDNRIAIKEYYSVEIFVDGSFSKPLTDNFSTCRIKDSIKLVYPVFYLYFHIDNDSIIKNNVYTQCDIKVKIVYTKDDGKQTSQENVFDLLLLEINVDLPPKAANDHSDERDDQRRPICMTCIPKKASLYATTCMNRLFSEGTSVTPYDAIVKLISDAQIEKKIISGDNKNSGKLGQLIIPPMTFISAIDYIDDSFSIYKGQTFRHFTHDGIYQMWDIKKHYDSLKSGFIKIHKLPSYSPDPKLFDRVSESCNSSDTEFLVYDMVESLSRSSDVLLTEANNKNFVFHPTHDIVFMSNQKVLDKIEPLGLNAGVPDIKSNPKLKDRYSVDTSHIGHWNDFWTKDFKEELITSTISETLRDMNAVKFKIHRSLKIDKLMSIGETLFMKPYSEHEKTSPSNYEGAYLITEYDIKISNKPDGVVKDSFEASAEIYACRTSQSL